MSINAPLEQVAMIGMLAWLAAILLTPLIRRFAVSIGCVALPSSDRWGHRAIARLGGLPIALGFLAAAGWALQQDPRMLGLLLGGLLMMVIGLADDFRPLHPYYKLMAQILAGCLVTLFEIQINTRISWLTTPLTIGWLVLVMNAFNLMDNMDGLSAGIGAIAASFCAWHALQTGEFLIAMVSASLAGATLGFLRYNLPPAKIFMGDTGSQVLGLGLGSLALMGRWNHSTQLIGILALPTLLLAVPIFDTCFVTVQRIRHGRHPFQGGKDHLSHRLGILGLTTRQVVFTLYGISATFGVLSLLLMAQSPMLITGVWLLTVGLFLLIGTYLAKVGVYTPGASSVAAVISEPRVTFIDTMLLHKKRLLELSVDFVLICACYVMAHALRFEARLTPDLEILILKSLPWVIGIQMLCFAGGGLYRSVWRYTSLVDLVNIFRAVTFASVFSALITLYLWRFEGYSRAVFIIDGLLLFVMISGSRITERLLNEWISASTHDALPVLIVGAGDTGESLLRQLKQSAPGKRRVVGFLDDDVRMHGSRIHGIPIIGSRQELRRAIQEYGVREVLIAMPRPPADLLQQIQSYCEETGIPWRVVGTLAHDEFVMAPGA